ncbi:PilT/PilU family type 4a pilus ATPase [Leptogranulimonas caecicola]|uniref:Twitching motility protein n=1 Tax=Leptogranulimonas caecicola TaxID=2894156 RepID=A0AAU9CHK7_9ACTN|nr:PilT/PilU family type 4a pilus ATPase [Leptogranulimonas caecicola]BDC90461.1 twitching motility protein [Leptogranulimonas caecicola]
MDISALLASMIEKNASDVFFVAGLPITWASAGQQHRLDGGPLMPQDTQEVVEAIYGLAGRSMAPFLESRNHDDDFSFAVGGVGRFRVNVFRQRGSLGAVIRVIPFALPRPEELGIPDQVMDCASFNKGLVLVTGPAGAGKSTTLACLIDRLNHSRSGHIVTMEDPIEFVHRHNTCIVTQREIPTDVATYGEALRSAMRESPDVILLGEMRDRETVSTAVTAAETAQLLFSTLHTTGGASTIDRIVDFFDPVQQHQIRLQLAMVLQAVVSQQLVPTVDGGVAAAFEVMVANTAIRNLIREQKTHQIDSVIAASAQEGMISMDASLFELVKSGQVSSETALRYANHTESLARRLKAAGV